MQTKTIRLIAALLVMMFVVAPHTAFALGPQKDSVLSDDVSFSIEGNSSRFRIDKKKGSIELADCIVTSVRAHRTTWEIPEEYKNQETIQQIFDLFAHSEWLKMSEEHLTALNQSEWDYYAYGGVAIDFVSPKGASNPPIYQKDGQGYGIISFTPLDAQTDDSLENLVYVILDVFTNKGVSSKDCYVYSEKLYDLILRMSRQSYDVKDLSKAQSLEIYGVKTLAEFSMPWHDDDAYHAVVEDQETIKSLVKVFTAGEKWDARLKTAPEWLLRFTMPDGTVKVAYIAEPALAWDWRPMEQWQGNIFLMTGDSLFTIEQTSYEAVFRSVGLPRRGYVQQVQASIEERFRTTDCIVS